ncbi:ImmA/IrrE family metallo-endopeptidase [Jeotgalibacillus aurantiacus]|uniref:ImmA/IrrE family metallo-endopeptidase n=1 Tax=Jeotgalibacillus aurantiacus TaxID=2763266 RepID=UPI001D0B3618|nr:ImmA/IrrE family metallo-endopeptidase [Jeotgalibacillus aurantiacus]
MRYEKLLDEYPELIVKEDPRMPDKLPGFIVNNFISINKNISLPAKYFILAEEIGHYVTTEGDILNLNDIRHMKAEIVARRWGYHKVLSFDHLIECYQMNILTCEELCDHFELEPGHVDRVLKAYIEKYGLSVEYKGYTIEFEPLNIHKKF